MDDRYSAPGREYGRSYGVDRDDRSYSARDYSYSSARDYAAAGEDLNRYGRREQGRDRDRGYSNSDSNYGSYGASNRGWRDDEYRNSDWNDGRRAGGYGRSDYGRSGYGRDDDRGYNRGWQGSPSRGDDDRGFFDRAGDEVRSWFGDEEAERRRERDRRYDEQRAGTHDEHYSSWRRSRIAELDNDYDEYRRENAQRFESEFNNWRTERQGQRQGLSRVTEHMEVVGSDGEHVGTVDKVRGDRIVLTKNDSDAGGHHHSIPSRWIQSVDDKVTIRKTADEAKAHWRDEDRSGALFGKDGSRRDGDSWKTDHNLNRSFSGTY